MPHPKQGYHTKDGQKAPGTTTIIGRFKDSGALLYWACEQGKAIERGEISALYDRRNSAADAGTAAHALVEAHINGQPYPKIDASDEVMELAEQGFANYLSWERNNKIVVVHQELGLVSERHRFGGCIDAIGMDADDKRVLLDWKTSNSVYQDHLVQLAAYKMLWDEHFPEQPLTGGLHLLRFSKDHGDFAHHFYSDLSEAAELFLLYRRAYDLDKQLKKRV